MAKRISIFLTEAEGKLARIIWREAPMSSPELVALADRELDWRKSTTYTVLKKLCNKGVFSNRRANVTVLLTPDEQKARESRGFVEDAFGGSLPRFVSAFIGNGKLTAEQAAELQRLIDEHEDGSEEGKPNG